MFSSIVFAFALAASSVDAKIVLNPKNYPKVNETAPANPKWTKKFNVKIANLPLETKEPFSKKLNLGIQYCMNPHTFGLTYEDGPTPVTNKVLGTLDNVGFKATFFVVGSRVLEHPDILKKAFDDQHQIALHTWSHKHLTSLPTEQVISEIMWSAKIVKDVIGVTPKYFRPPFNELDERIASIVKSMGLTLITAGVDGKDKLPGSDPLMEFENFFKNATNNNVSPIGLLHDYNATQGTQAESVISGIRDSGYSVMTLEQCLLMNGQSYGEDLWAGL